MKPEREFFDPLSLRDPREERAIQAFDEGS